MTDGWHLDEDTLLPVLDDERAFRAAHHADPAVNALVLLFAGYPRAAEIEVRRLLTSDTESRRLRALLADSLRDQGRVCEAEEMYRELIDSERDPLRRATFTQHLGKVLFAAGSFAEAEALFDDALAARISLGAAANLIASSQTARTVAARRQAQAQAQRTPR